MIDKDKIPEPLYNELIELFGEEEVERYAKKVGYNFISLRWKVEDYRFKKRFGIKLHTLMVIIFIIILLYSFIRF